MKHVLINIGAGIYLVGLVITGLLIAGGTFGGIGYIIWKLATGGSN